MVIFGWNLLIAGYSVPGRHYSSCNVCHVINLQWSTCNSLLAIVYLRWQVIEIILTSSLMRCHMKAYENLRLMMNTV